MGAVYPPELVGGLTAMENLEKRYRSHPDSELERLAYYEAKELTPEALNVLKSETGRRFPEQNLQGALKIQMQGL